MSACNFGILVLLNYICDTFVFRFFFRVELNPCIFVLGLNPCIEPGGRPPGDNYNHLSVPDPATACGNLLYRERGGRRKGDP